MSAPDPIPAGPVEFSIEIATVNGSGSLTANQVLLRALFRSGLPVSGKNLFPSNISGLPTWFQIRASTRGHVARQPDTDLMVCLNPESAKDDVARLRPGALVIYDEPLNLESLRGDLSFCPIPFQILVAASCPEPRLHRMVKNMLYVGVIACLIGLDLDRVLEAIAHQLEGKAKAIELNRVAAQAAFHWAAANLPPQDRIRIRPAALTDGKLLMDGNTACALGALFAGVTVAAWYPITPSSSVIETLEDHAAQCRKDPETGRSTVAVVQMEDELAAAGVVVGAGWAGARAMTATSGPGISLMSEFIGLAYWTETPGVFIDVQRTGPSTGLPTHTMQGDIELCATCSHGDTLHPCFYPASPAECFAFTYAAFELAEHLQTPVFVVSDLDLGMQTWVTDRFACPAPPLERGKVLGSEQLAALEDWGRYKDMDGDGIGWRTLPGTPGGRGAYFARGTGHNAYGLYSERPADYLALVDRLLRKVQGAAPRLPEPVIRGEAATVGIIAYGSSDPAVIEAQDLLQEQRGTLLDYLRVRAYPFRDEIAAWIAAHDRVYVVDQNRDGQMRNLLGRAFPELAARLRSVRHYDSTSIPARTIMDQILAQEGRG